MAQGEQIRRLAGELSAPDLNLPVGPTEYDREIRFFNVGACNYESVFYFNTRVSTEKLRPLLSVQEPIRGNEVLSEKYRKNIYRRTLLIDGQFIRKEFSGTESAHNLFSNGLNFLKNGCYRERLVEFHADERAHFYYYTYRKDPGSQTFYDMIFDENAPRLPEVYNKYFALVKELWPFVHLDLHGDNISIAGDKWFAVDFESVVQMSPQHAYLLYHGLFTQIVCHRRNFLGPEFEYMSFDEFERLVE